MALKTHGIKIIVIIMLLSVSACAKIRSKLSESSMGNHVLDSYDWTSDAVGNSFDYSMEKVSHFIDEADEAWLDDMLDSIYAKTKKSGKQTQRHSRIDKSPDQLDITFDGKMTWPVKYSNKIRLSSQFGFRWGRKHKGIDLSGPTGTPVYSVESGKVIYAGNSMRGFGNLIIIEHQNGLSSYYAHNSKLKVRKGARVNKGYKIALMGSTGRSTGTHLHFEVRKGRVAVNPCLFLPAHAKFTCKT